MLRVPPPGGFFRGCWIPASRTVITEPDPAVLAHELQHARGERLHRALDDARRLVIDEIKRAKREGVKVLKVIHGYGSSGKGGALGVGLLKSFRLRKKEGAIKDFIAGEDFSIFNDPVLTLLEAVPEMRGDPDLNATNEGITVLWLK